MTTVLREGVICHSKVQSKWGLRGLDNRERERGKDTHRKKGRKGKGREVGVKVGR